MFEYRCKSCGNEFEELVFNDNQPIPCPKCGGKETEKLMSCCRHKQAGGPGIPAAVPSSGGSSCASCSGGNCSTCH